MNYEILSKNDGEKYNDIDYKVGIGAGIAFTLVEGLVLSPAISYNLIIDNQWAAPLL
ncbi:MAG: hypothetical protein R2771_07875 [Saprospiraceae bacterium]